MRLNPVLEKLTPYRAGPPLADIRRRYHLEQIAQLSANESPWGPFPEVVEAMKAALDGLNRYPDGGCGELRACWLSEQGCGKRIWCLGTAPASYSCCSATPVSVLMATWCFHILRS